MYLDRYPNLLYDTVSKKRSLSQLMYIHENVDFESSVSYLFSCTLNKESQEIL